jgi:hypothetical protein
MDIAVVTPCQLVPRLSGKEGGGGERREEVVGEGREMGIRFGSGVRVIPSRTWTGINF